MLRRALLITGGRDYHYGRRDGDVLLRVIGERNITDVIHGDAKHVCRDPWCVQRLSIDQYAGKVALEQRCKVHVMPADWTKYGLSAGPRRNREMVSLLREIGGDALGFPGGVGTRGTLDMVVAARKRYRRPIEILLATELFERYDLR